MTSSQFQSSHDRSREEIELLPALTFVLWISCFIIGFVGLRVRRAVPPPSEKPPAVVEAQLLNVDLTQTLSANIPSQANALPTETPAPSNISSAVPPMPVIAEPSSAIAFAVPTERPVTPVASIIPRASSVVPTQAIPVQLVFGQGEGQQPAPDYPPEAILAGQEGVVVVQFSVGTDGRVKASNATTPSRFPLLNQAAIQTIRDQWRFHPGKAQLYQVSIEFYLNKH